MGALLTKGAGAWGRGIRREEEKNDHRHREIERRREERHSAVFMSQVPVFSCLTPGTRTLFTYAILLL